tara:strand:- start:105 stop:647 length:543 start_codon:yes stop_codon:yes gene_type:complete
MIYKHLPDIYKNSPYNHARYSLGKTGSNMLITIGVNPNTADDKESDSTTNNVINFSKKKGFDGWLILNPYPQRKKNPKNLDKKINPEYHQENLQEIKKRVSEQNNPTIWCAWGNSIEKRKYLFKCLKDIYLELKEFHVEWIRFGDLTEKDHPHHPLYLPHDSQKHNFDIKNYLDKKAKFL